jgi:DNA-binding response OmpR family regulator
MLPDASFRNEIGFGEFIYSPDTGILEGPACKKKLSLRESQLLTYLLDYRNIMIGRADILIAIWGVETKSNSRNLDVYINRLRKTLSGDPHIQIETRKGIGFFFRTSDF